MLGALGRAESDHWKGEESMEWTGPLLLLKQKTGGALWVPLRPPGGAEARR